MSINTIPVVDRTFAQFIQQWAEERWQVDDFHTVGVYGDGTRVVVRIKGELKAYNLTDLVRSGVTVGVADLPNGTLLLDVSIETNQLVFFSVTEQFFDLTTTTSFNAGETLMGTVEVGFEGDTNALAQFIVRMLIEGVEVKTAGLSTSPATGAGDTPAIQPQGSLSGIRTLATGGTKTLRIGVVSINIGNADVVLYNRRIYRIKNASS